MAIGVVGANDLIEDDETSALAASREVIVSSRSTAPVPEPVRTQVVGPLPLVTTPPRRTPPPFFPAVDQLTASMSEPPASAPRPSSAPPVFRQPSTRTPFVIDVLPTSIMPVAMSLFEERRRILPLAAVIAAGAVLLLVIGATLIARRDSASTSAAAAQDPPSTQVVAPLPVATDLPPRASASASPRPPAKKKSGSEP
jgi:hypothetical protein